MVRTARNRRRPLRTLRPGSRASGKAMVLSSQLDKGIRAFHSIDGYPASWYRFGVAALAPTVRVGRARPSDCPSRKVARCPGGVVLWEKVGKAWRF